MVSLNFSSSSLSPRILCRYTNPTSRCQIIRISNIPHSFFERVVMPQGTTLFTTVQGAKLEVHTGVIVNSILSDIIPCDRLAEASYEPLESVHFFESFTQGVLA